MDFYLGAFLQGLCLTAMAFGIFISMKIFNIPDITTDGSYTLGGSVTGVLLAGGMSGFLVLPVVLVAGAVAGAVTGLIHTRLKINALLAGILVMTGLYSVNLSIMGRSNIPLMQVSSLFNSFELVSTRDGNALIALAGFIGLLFIMLGYVLKTDFGLAMRATGNSESMIRALGVNTDAMKITGLAIANALVAVSGYLITQFQGFVDINMGIGIVIVGLGSVIIGESLVHTLKIGSVWGILAMMFIGAAVFQLVLAFSLSMGVHPNMLKLVTALFVLLIVGIPRLGFLKLDRQ
jgi:putative tryptophan/tyrosine transport system permease protein